MADKGRQKTDIVERVPSLAPAIKIIEKYKNNPAAIRSGKLLPVPTLSGDIRQDGEKLGHLLAIKGDNPIISDLINELTTYRFGIERVNVKTKNELLQEEYWQRSQKNYSEIFRKLHWVCVGYLDAQKLSYVRAVRSMPVPNDETSDEADSASGGLTLKQQVLLIHRLGILDSPGIRDLTTQNQGKLFGRLFRRNEKNTEDLIRTRHEKNVEKRHSLAGKEVTEAVDALLDESLRA